MQIYCVSLLKRYTLESRTLLHNSKFFLSKKKNFTSKHLSIYFQDIELNLKLNVNQKYTSKLSRLLIPKKKKLFRSFIERPSSKNKFSTVVERSQYGSITRLTRASTACPDQISCSHLTIISDGSQPAGLIAINLHHLGS